MCAQRYEEAATMKETPWTTAPQAGISKFQFLAMLIIVVGLLPIAGYWYWIGRGPGLEPQQAWDIVHTSVSNAVLVDVRSPEDFAAGHLEGAVNWPYHEIMALTRLESMPHAYAGKKLILICSGGILDASAAKQLQKTVGAEAYFVKGGMQGWIEHSDQPCGLALLIKASSADKSPLPSRVSSGFEQWVVMLSGFGIKPVYMLLSLIVIIVLRRSSASDLVALRWSMIFFLAGELACALNYLIFSHGSHLVEYLHSYGMVAGFGFAMYAIFEGIDNRLIHLSDPNRKCAALLMCRACIKYGDNPCRLKQLFYFAIPASAIVAAIPFSSQVKAVSYGTHILGTFYYFSHSVLYQIYEIRYCPMYAIIFFLISFFVLRYKKNAAIEWAKIFFAAGAGALGFGLLRLMLYSMHSDNQVWFDFWEEITELIFVAAVCIILWLFRKTLFSSASENEHA
jgi:phage shock protein E